jgi:DNA-binding FadR family transcriptional regulator
VSISESAFVPRAITALKTGELIATEIRRQIISGVLSEGDALPGENELMEMYNVSRPTLREAFRILEAEQLIKIRRGARGARVMAPTVAVAAKHFGALLQIGGTTIGDVYDARAIIEPAAAGMLAARRTEEDLAELESCIAHLVDLLTRDVGPVEWGQAAQRFHDLVVDLSGNKTLALQSKVLREIVASHLSIAMHTTFDASRGQAITRYRVRTVRSYRRLVGFIEAGDSAGATEHWKVHMDVAAKSLLGRGIREKAVVDLFS